MGGGVGSVSSPFFFSTILSAYSAASTITCSMSSVFKPSFSDNWSERSRRRCSEDAKDENTQSNSKTIQDHRQRKAAPPEARKQPSASQEVKACASLPRQGRACGEGGSEARTTHSGVAKQKGIAAAGIRTSPCRLLRTYR